MYHRAYLYGDKKGTKEQFKLRAQQTIRAPIGVVWQLRDLTSKAEVPPHPYRQFVRDLKHGQHTIEGAVEMAVERGYTVRFDPLDHKKAAIYIRPDNRHLLYNYEDNDQAPRKYLRYEPPCRCIPRRRYPE